MSYHAQLGEALLVLFPAANPLVDYRVQDDGAGPFIAEWGLPDPQPTEQEVLDAVPLIPEARDNEQKAAAKTAVDSTHSGGRVSRSEAALIVSELNLIRQWLMTFKAEVAAATSLADLKARVATLPNMPDRTLQQALNAMKAAIDAGA